MEWAANHIEALGVFCGAALALWSLLARFDKLYRMHLSEQFASKRDFNRLEKKVDALLIASEYSTFKSKHHG